MIRIVPLLLVVPLAAFAGKTEREFVKTRLAPAIKKSEATFKKACGCNWKLAVGKKLENDLDALHVAEHLVGIIGDNAAGYCTDDASKKALCAISTFSMETGETTGFSVEGKVGKAVLSGGYPPWDNITAALDK